MCVQVAKPTVKPFEPSGSPIILVFCAMGRWEILTGRYNKGEVARPEIRAIVTIEITLPSKVDPGAFSGQDQDFASEDQDLFVM